MVERITVGAFEVLALEDGIGHLPASMYVGVDVASASLDGTGTVPIRLGAFLVTGGDVPVLIDAGAGPESMPFPPSLAEAAGLDSPPQHIMESGALLHRLAEIGVSPEDIGAVLLTHLHVDHVGWIMDGDVPVFPNATVYYGEDDWPVLVDAAAADDPVRRTMIAAHEAGVLEPYWSADQQVLPGLRALHAPGHTPGSTVVVLESGGRSALFTGDTIEHLEQLTDRRVRFISDMDTDGAAEQRDRLFSIAEHDGAVIATAHIAGPAFLTVRAGSTWASAK